MNPLKALSLVAIGALASAAMAPSASASLIVNAAVGGAPLGVTYVNFDNLPLGSAGGVSGGVGVSFVPDGQTVVGAISGQAAAPFISNSNGAPFGDPTVSGADTTKYLSTGLGQVHLTLPGQQTYLGMLWGSVDTYNTLELFNGSTLVGTITGSMVTASANGDQGLNGTYYVNILSSLAFDTVVASSSQYAFEFDNLSFSGSNPEDITPPVPEPATLMLIGLGVSSLGMIRRKKVLA